MLRAIGPDRGAVLDEGLTDDLSGVVARPRLDLLIDRELVPVAACTAVLLSAPPGFGKTTLAHTWAHRAEAAGWPVAWLQLTAAGASRRLFWREVVAAIRASGEEWATALRGLHPPETAGDELFVLELVDRLVGGRLLVVLDGVDLLHDAVTLRAFDHFLHRLPSGVRVVMTSRTLPPLPTVLDHRLDGRLAHLRARDLAFTEEETGLVCPWLGPEDRRAVWSGTEGWPALTRLVGVALRGGGRVADVWDDERPLMDAVFGEGLRRIGPEALSVLMAASVAETVPLALVTELTRCPHAGALLDDAGRATGLVHRVRDHDGRIEYHLHASLRVYLQAEQLRRDAVLARDRHARSAKWFLDHGAALQATDHAVRSEHDGVLEAVLARAGPGLVAVGRSERLLALLPGGAHSPGGRWVRAVRAAALLDLGRAAEAATEVDVMQGAAAGRPRSQLSRRRYDCGS
ncbi:hypothetical protein H9L10_00330 [Phycicoccus endophyticus]|uniref:AAA+ ATPase domain-containing protein n=1 Tax=Phycicoccus endophyticus TaxID=1690220 RepID=A0A7G9R1Z3_9MICO|nr:hypothetical protein [Phycicoccus endophyticus]QNN49618.1 hypothetical protein H9L10_00330 [Phycicoccus endophyticus]